MPPVKRRESRSGSRKVSALSAEQLERKRANDRDAQRSIRQRTKEHIEQLEAQVASLKSQIAEMRLRDERFDELIKHNAFLENEVRRLKCQVASLTGRPELAGSTEPIAPFRGVWPPQHIQQHVERLINMTGTNHIHPQDRRRKVQPRTRSFTVAWSHMQWILIYIQGNASVPMHLKSALAAPQVHPSNIQGLLFLSTRTALGPSQSQTTGQSLSQTPSGSIGPPGQHTHSRNKETRHTNIHGSLLPECRVNKALDPRKFLWAYSM
ncbi:uncharacterized protein N7515_007331 [Penicillium bovifimosum]|uniref:BZIP domain-containing protein n=1 Tax=Penicillium bovifimosum TaxID=126998 RepID=A0A9W9GWD7_9EURO|nr:uncharacterized protein N7515_007331 [Penicillium bovifimosum]KAJ5131292.1 hypothetical protein N7515_007331 [Penicillium bovifimosum]